MDSGKVGKFYSVRDSVFYPIIATVIDGNKPIGYLVSWKVFVANTNAVQQLSQLLGTDAQLYFGNDDGNLWTDMIRPVKFPGTKVQEMNTVMEYSREDKSVMGLIQPIPNSHWLILIELPKEKILEAANRFFYWLLIAGGLILIIGISITRLISRNIIKPLKDLTIVASEIASGNYSINVNNTRRDELGKLAQAFNVMKIKVGKAQEKLQMKAENYKLLFENNPMPMWIISSTSHSIMDANKAALVHYGYSKNEFLQLSIQDIWCEEDRDKHQEYVKNTSRHKMSGVCKHVKKNGT